MCSFLYNRSNRTPCSKNSFGILEVTIDQILINLSNGLIHKFQKIYLALLLSCFVCPIVGFLPGLIALATKYYNEPL